MNRLRITLLLSTLMLPGLAFSVDESSSDVNASKSDQIVPEKTVDETTEVSKKLSAEAEQGGKIGDLSETPSKDLSKSNATNKGLLKGALCWSAGLVVRPIDWIATPLVSGIGKLATLKCLKDRCVGSWLTSHNKGLSRAVVVTLIGGAVYYYWKKCQECKKAEDETSRSMSSSYNFFEVQDDEDMTQSV